MKLKPLTLSILAILVSIVIILIIEGILSYYYSSNYFFQKKIFLSYKNNTVIKKDISFTDPYNKKIKSSGRTLANRYTNATGGRWAPNTLAIQYTYNDYHERKSIGLFTDNYGFIHNGNPDRKLFQKDYYNIIIIGGSTVEGAHTTSSNENTIAANLEKKMRKNKSKVNVINAGFAGYSSFDEFLTIYNLLGQYSFQEVIFLNGANDFLSLTYSSKKKWNYYEEIINYREQFSHLFDKRYQLKTSYYITRLKNKILNFFTEFSKKNEPNVYEPNQDHLVNIFQEKFDTYEPNPPSVETVENYISNIRLMKSLCIQFNIKCKFFLQPFLSSKNLLHNVEKENLSKIPFKDFKNTESKWYEIAASELKKISENKNIKFYDIRDTFKNESNLVYYDMSHYNDFGNELIADKIYETFNEK